MLENKESGVSGWTSRWKTLRWWHLISTWVFIWTTNWTGLTRLQPFIHIKRDSTCSGVSGGYYLIQLGLFSITILYHLNVGGAFIARRAESPLTTDDTIFQLWQVQAVFHEEEHLLYLPPQTHMIEKLHQQQDVWGRGNAGPSFLQLPSDSRTNAVPSEWLHQTQKKCCNVQFPHTGLIKVYSILFYSIQPSCVCKPTDCLINCSFSLKTSQSKWLCAQANLPRASSATILTLVSLDLICQLYF